MKSINMVDHRFNTFYKRLWGFVSTQVQSLIFDELKRSTFASVDSFAWGCTLRTTHGLLVPMNLLGIARLMAQYHYRPFMCIGRCYPLVVQTK